MDKISDALAQAFCEDCHARMQRVVDIVHAGAQLNRVQLDQLHQEFDTLFGGARAVHLPDMEQYFRSMARYSRYLRNLQMAGQEVDARDWQRLLTGIGMWRGCSGKLSCCFLLGSDSNRMQLLQDMENIMNNGDAK